MDKLPSKREFKKWRSPVRGAANPERMDNPFWHWCVRSRESAYAANEQFGGPSSIDAGPCWCFDRFGQAELELPDGRTVFTGGEHEDYYDPDFFIYNDVVVVDGDEVSIFGYPEAEFPPTDFHSATLVDDASILLIGNLGYPDDRRVGETQVLRLDLDTWAIAPVPTSGDLPGWVYGHSARVDDSGGSILISGGERCGKRITENFNDYELSLATWRWKQTTSRNWKAWVLERADGAPNGLWEIRTASRTREIGISMESLLQDSLQDLPDDVVAELMPTATDEQIEKIQSLYQSPLDGTPAVEDEDEENYGRYRFAAGDTPVRIDEDNSGVTVTVEGELAEKETGAILAELQKRLTSIEGVEYTVTALDA